MIDSSLPFPDPARPSAGGQETHRLVASGLEVALALQFEQRQGRAGFQTVVFGLSSPAADRTLPVVISAVDVRFGQAWELRTSGLWAEQVRERSFDHWSYGLEAFALAIDRPDELTRQALGHRIPFGWELDFIADEPPVPIEGSAAGSFSQSGCIDGLILTGHGDQPMDGAARRYYWAGEPPAHTEIVGLGNRVRSRPGSVILPSMYGPWTVAPASVGQPEWERPIGEP